MCRLGDILEEAGKARLLPRLCTLSPDVAVRGFGCWDVGAPDIANVLEPAYWDSMWP